MLSSYSGKLSKSFENEALLNEVLSAILTSISGQCFSVLPDFAIFEKKLT